MTAYKRAANPHRHTFSETVHEKKEARRRELHKASTVRNANLLRYREKLRRQAQEQQEEYG